MDSIEESIYKGIKKYRRTLTMLGQLKQVEIDRILVACFLNDLYGDFYGVLPEGDSKFILDCLKKLSVCSCLLPCITKYNSSSGIVSELNETFRVREDGDTAQVYENEFYKLFE